MSDSNWRGFDEVDVKSPHPIFRSAEFGDVAQIEVRRNNRPITRLPGDLYLEDVKAQLREDGVFGELTLMAVGRDSRFAGGGAVPIAVTPVGQPVMSSLNGSRFVRGATSQERERAEQADRETAIEREREALRRRQDELLEEQRRSMTDSVRTRELASREATDTVARTAEVSIGHMREMSELRLMQIEADRERMAADLRRAQDMLVEAHTKAQQRIDELRDREQARVDAAVAAAEQRFAIERASLQAALEDERRRAKRNEEMAEALRHEVQRLQMEALEARLTRARPERSETEEELAALERVVAITREAGGDPLGVLRSHGFLEDQEKKDEDEDDVFKGLVKKLPTYMQALTKGNGSPSNGGGGGLGGLTVKEV